MLLKPLTPRKYYKSSKRNKSLCYWLVLPIFLAAWGFLICSIITFWSPNTIPTLKNIYSSITNKKSLKIIFTCLCGIFMILFLRFFQKTRSRLKNIKSRLRIWGRNYFPEGVNDFLKFELLRISKRKNNFFWITFTITLFLLAVGIQGTIVCYILKALDILKNTHFTSFKGSLKAADIAIISVFGSVILFWSITVLIHNFFHKSILKIWRLCGLENEDLLFWEKNIIVSVLNRLNRRNKIIALVFIALITFPSFPILLPVLFLFACGMNISIRD